MNQYHKDDSIDEMLKFLDNAHDIFLRKYGKDYPVTGAQIQNAFFLAKSIVKDQDSEGLIIE